jgi:hypothetical protein
MSGPAKPQKALALRPTSYEVGYGKPPVHSRFKPGRSGNPKGRPKGSQNRVVPTGPVEERLKAIILQEAYREVPINDGKGQVTIPMAQAVVRSLAVSAAKGSQRAQRLFTQLLATTEREHRVAREKLLEAVVTYKVEWGKELDRRRRLGVTAPDPLPHPDHLVIDLAEGTVQIEGPATREEKVLWAIWSDQLRIFEADLKELEDYVEDPEASERDEALADIEKLKTGITFIRLALKGSRKALKFLKDISDQHPEEIARFMDAP